jgi:hypothetical protein
MVEVIFPVKYQHFDDVNVNRNVLPSSENRKNVYEPHTIFRKLMERWSKLGLFLVSNLGKQVAL